MEKEICKSCVRLCECKIFKILPFVVRCPKFKDFEELL